MVSSSYHSTSVTPGAGAGTGGGSSLGRFSQPSQLWEAALGLLTAIISYVRVEDEMFDEILELVVDVLPGHPELREALETVNGDAVWLGLYERGLLLGVVGPEQQQQPVMEGFGFVRVGVR
ncbi:hypothetical protein B0T21DRAFT_410445 [Apiosordaria backusii]|uniref:Uncharacterized protein n=1 Tax=Apiosordaria backusii TaxID=314023 RepID=A0AA40BMI5_9PEZI|nr:hypothetical protein B0T21DRAFT_410445 [Apiosordaria backusii]